MEFAYKTNGVCARKIKIDLEGDTIKSVAFEGGCNGNTKGVASLVKGMKIDDIIENIVDDIAEDIAEEFAEEISEEAIAEAIEEAIEDAVEDRVEIAIEDTAATEDTAEKNNSISVEISISEDHASKVPPCGLKCCEKAKADNKHKKALIGVGIAAATLGIAYLIGKSNKK